MPGTVVRYQPEEEGAERSLSAGAGWSEIVALAPAHPAPFLPCRRSPGIRAAARPQALAHVLALCVALCSVRRAVSRPRPLCGRRFRAGLGLGAAIPQPAPHAHGTPRASGLLAEGQRDPVRTYAALLGHPSESGGGRPSGCPGAPCSAL